MPSVIPKEEIYLCSDCLNKRIFDLRDGQPPRQIGILSLDKERSSWVDVEPVILYNVTNPTRRIVVEIKLQVPLLPSPTCDDGGRVIMRIGGRKHWENNGCINCTLFSIILMKLMASYEVQVRLEQQFSSSNIRVLKPKAVPIR
jgi:hypothetical protein